MAGTPSSSLASQATTFSLDITLVEDTDAFAESINLTDDNCGTTCPNACCTSSS
ncbi:FxLD family lanthipeptide [Nocardiopsis protaetiae]|uniref:FxLD family lanthipeptide n=1 Tax=Nocardiopsis protaetiae TaxID=3382270 RepID=UPI00387B4E86